ncbi:MAG: hypothetical protein ABEK36_02390 [Candidatus Aenigmatarchaeota archaeon]
MKPENMWELTVVLLAILGIGFVFVLGYYTSGGETQKPTGLKPLTFNCEKSSLNEITCEWDNCYSEQTIIALSGGVSHTTDKIRGSYKFKDLDSGEYHTVLSCGDRVKIDEKIVIE